MIDKTGLLAASGKFKQEDKNDKVEADEIENLKMPLNQKSTVKRSWNGSMMTGLLMMVKETNCFNLFIRKMIKLIIINLKQ